MVEILDPTREPRRLVGGAVRLTVIIGDGQLGGTALKLDDVPIGMPGDVKNQPIGDAVSLDGRTLEVRTLVADVNLQSNHTSVTYVLTGVAEEPLTLTHLVAEHGNAAFYDTFFRFGR
jgi:hypothetical protein